MSEKIKDMKANILRLLSENAELKRERDEARQQRDAWEKVAISNAEKLGCLLFGKAEGVK